MFLLGLAGASPLQPLYAFVYTPWQRATLELRGLAWPVLVSHTFISQRHALQITLPEIVLFQAEKSSSAVLLWQAIDDRCHCREGDWS